MAHDQIIYYNVEKRSIIANARYIRENKYFMDMGNAWYLTIDCSTLLWQVFRLEKHSEGKVSEVIENSNHLKKQMPIQKHSPKQTLNIVERHCRCSKDERQSFKKTWWFQWNHNNIISFEKYLKFHFWKIIICTTYIFVYRNIWIYLCNLSQKLKRRRVDKILRMRIDIYF